ncbi:MAG: isoleucine--tRNA ligase [Candidatus Omnitrophica bacterium]|nr:isoleucine--tRNA ligase [Candidatus Omnitrophota bacterium]
MEYKDTLNLPKTDFPMKANLPQREPQMLKRWKEQDIYRLMSKKREKAPKYVLHDGPPYANGDIHMGHVLNKILKDIVIKFNTLAGYNVPYIPGWDCHGLPVEHQLMKKLGIEKGDIPQVKFRNKARDFALKFVKIQKAQFERLGIFGDWENPYLTLNPEYEGAIIRSFAELVGKGYIYKDLKPVNWCYKCETALAEAEIEYNPRTSPSVFVKFKLNETGRFKKALGSEAAARVKGDAHVLIWTTTPWTLVANVAIALAPTLKYVLVENSGSYLILAQDLFEALSKKLKLAEPSIISTFKGRDLEGFDCAHPFIDRTSKIVLADYVSHEEGTGCVHTAPGHGHEDYLTGKKYGLPTVMPVDSKGRFDETAAEFKGLHVFDANKKIIEKLKSINSLMHSEDAGHSYPHCWRCKSPIIFRATAQYFMNVDHDGLRTRVGKFIGESVKWVPEAGQGRISTMVRNRPDWCLSRQRLWGVPITALYCAECDELLLDKDIINHVAGIFEKEGSGAWFIKAASELIPAGTKCKKCGSDEFEKELDILDVWFESGVSHQAVLKPRKEFPADLYLEGSDQHRGWFQSAILTSTAIDGSAPYKSVLTHGFVVDGEGKKMSKSLGNVISPEDVMKRYGADILRIWVASCDYRDDVRLSEVILARLADAYRKIRNTSRYMLGNLYDFDPANNAVPIEDMSEIDKWAMWRACRLLETAESNFKNFAFHKVFNSIYNFCVVDMSSIYLDVLKDTLYTAGRESRLRRGAQSALYEIISILSRVMAPVLAYTSEEVWRSLPGVKAESIYLEDWPDLKKLKQMTSGAFGESYIRKWSDRLLPLRDSVLKMLEEARGEGVIGSSLDAKVVLYSDNKEWLDTLDQETKLFNTLFIVSSVEIAKDPPSGSRKADEIPVSIRISKADGNKCQRCWNYASTVGADKEHPGLCLKCGEVVRGLKRRK